MSQLNPKIKFYITDACNERCIYCPINTERAKNTSRKLLSGDAIAAIAKEAISLGYISVKFSAEHGEPLLRKDLEEMVASAKKFGAEEISIATNGLLLKDRLPHLLKAGVNKFCISLDSINPEKYKKITGVNGCEEVKEAITLAAGALGQNVKVNMVVIKEINDDEIEAMQKWVAQNGATLQLIEVFPVEGRRKESEAMHIALDGVLENLRRQSVYSSFYKPRKMEKFVLPNASSVEVTAVRRAPGSHFGSSRLLVHPNGDVANYDVSSTGYSISESESANSIKEKLKAVMKITHKDVGRGEIKPWRNSPKVS